MCIVLKKVSEKHDKDAELDDCNYKVDEILSDLEQISSNIIDNIENLDPDNRNNLPITSLLEFFNPLLIQNVIKLDI
ncbi:19521_t:CDS:2 [Dentiscutata erythropus]|uniref:19521_t:CDS:1 n=1 Tax=Dentiscutata erythropus TaxID=1348616 RepID=A0A9N9AJS1_9GLOM|nr:19521_t:CDS:2 [Dentiscutata erythropus]